MSDNIVLEHLRAIRATTDELKKEMLEQRVRHGATERSIAHLETEFAGLRVEMNGRFDRVLDRLERIERRLDLADAP